MQFRAPFAVLAIVVCAARLAQAQAWVPPQGVGAVTLLVQVIDHSGHRLDPSDPLYGSTSTNPPVKNGTLLQDGKSVNVDLAVAFDYAFTDRWSISASVPYVGSKYRGPGGPPQFVTYLDLDRCKCWHTAWQDVSAASRFNVITSSAGFALTPSVAVVLPTHDYAHEGEAVAGRDLRELQLSIDAAQRLDPISSRLSMSAQYAYAIVERVLDIPNNRSNLTLEGNYAVSRRLSVAGVVMWQHTHGGLRFPIEVQGFPERVVQHDRLLRDNSTHIGGRASYSFRRSKLDLFGSYIAFVSGTNTHAGGVLTVGLTRWFGV